MRAVAARYKRARASRDAGRRLASSVASRWVAPSRVGTAPAPTRIEAVIERYSRPAMARVWSEEAKLERWLAVELAALEAWASVGVVPAEAARAIRAAAVPPTVERVAEIERRTNHDVAAFVDAVAEQLGGEGRWFHYGLTSSDVLDTALSLAIRDAGALLLEGLDRAFLAVVSRAHEHEHTVQIGRTHGVHAEPTTFGLKLAGWAFQLARDRARLERALEGLRVGKLSGAVGTYATTSPEVERIACETLGLEPAPSSTQILQRDRHAELLSALALLASSLERYALEIRHLARTELREVEEPFGDDQKGSSAMPHKRNPIVSERICGLARVVRGYAQVGLENVALWHERDISHSSAERIVLPDAFLAVDYMLDRFAWLVEGLVVRPERMRANLEATGGLFYSQRLLLALVESGLERDSAYRLVQRHAMRAWDEGLDFRTLVAADPEISTRVDLDAVFNLAAYTRHTDVVFARLDALAGTVAAHG
jgi:adenylosuccinate lyase